MTEQDEPLIVRIIARGPLLGSRSVIPAYWISAAESERAADRAMARLPFGRGAVRSNTAAYHISRREVTG